MNIVELVKEYGVKNLLFYVPMRPFEFAGFIPGIALTSSSSTPEQIVACRIDESRYTVSDNYKITLRAEDERRFGRTHYYISDLQAHFRCSRERADNRFRCYVETIDGGLKV